MRTPSHNSEIQFCKFCDRVLRVLAEHPEGFTLGQLRQRTAIRDGNLAKALTALGERKMIEPCEVKGRHGTPLAGFRLVQAAECVEPAAQPRGFWEGVGRSI